MTNKLLAIVILVCFFGNVQAQDYTFQTFKDRRVINSHSVETLPKRKLDVRIAHRFGDMFGDSGGTSTFFGLETAADVAIGAEYGISDNLNIGFYRAKGAGQFPGGTAGLRQLWNGFVKYRILRQTEDGSMPFTLTLVGLTSISGQEKTELDDGTEPAVISAFPNFSDRIAYNFQVILGKKFSDAFSLQILPAYTHRNLVADADENGIFSIGIATRIQLTKVMGIIADATFPFSSVRSEDESFFAELYGIENFEGRFFPALGIGLEFETGGHVFQLNFTNATGLMETDYIPYTTSDWTQGQFRLGFTISRMFNL
ncbi:MAG: DUF5777 family beta-barrel protein [Saprospiraceae bacterium]|nr:DUF5777 family beta-barrel protein [Saprospiraceae bacterium]